jgi:hypothetical protein
MLFVLQWWIWGGVALLLGLIGVLLPPPPRSITGSLPSADARWLIHAWAAGCLVYVLIGSKELIDNPWNLHVFSPVAAAFVARAVHWVARPEPGVASTWAWARGAAVILILAVSGLHVANRMTSPRHATRSHELGKALRRASQPDDLVLTMAEKLGNPVAIYYSRRRGWIFPPASSDYAWTQIPPDRDSIRMLDELRERGADWFGLTMNQYQALWHRHRGLLDHLRQVSDFHSKGDDWLVYRLHPVSEAERQRREGRQGTERDGRRAGQDQTAVMRRVTSDH